MSWKKHRHAWRQMLGWGIPVVLRRLTVQDALLKAMASVGWLGSRAADALVWLLHMPFCGNGAGIQVFGYSCCSHIRALFEVTVSDCLQQCLNAGATERLVCKTYAVCFCSHSVCEACNGSGEMGMGVGMHRSC
jgi:hypothetical protein